jgi:spermidine/putrescine transport system substrate-binding protein
MSSPSPPGPAGNHGLAGTQPVLSHPTGASSSAAEFRAALAVLRRSVAAGQIRSVTNDYLRPMVKGTLAAGVAWSGGMLLAREVNPALQFTWPARGGMLWTDNMMIPSLAPVRANAERLMNFHYQPDPAAQLVAGSRFISPALGAQSAMRQIDPALATEKYIFPSAALLRSGHNFKILTRTQSARYTAEFNAAVGL